MAKYKAIKSSFTGKLDDVSSFLRQFNTVAALKRINRESNEMLFNSSHSDIHGAKEVSFSICRKGHNNFEKKETILTAWNLIDLSYYMIKFSNDYRGKIIEFDEELYVLHVAVDNYKEQNEPKHLDMDNVNEKIEFFMYLWGFVGEQIKLESSRLVKDNQLRDLYILFDINDTRAFDMEESLLAETGLSWKMIMAYLTLAWIGFTKVDTLEELSSLLAWNDQKNKLEFEKLIERYTTDYEEIRRSALGRQLLYAKPYVRTQTGQVISISSYLNYFLCEHGVLWIIRDHFKNLGRQDFVNYFGKLFEDYFQDLLYSTLNCGEYEKIPEQKTKRADWKINIDSYKFLIEQKSTAMRISAKQQETDIEAIRDFSVKTIIKALYQLYNTEKELNDGKYIKIILLYEDYLKPEILDQIMEMPRCSLENDNYYWLVTIRELEMLFVVAKNNRQLFREIVEEKIDREINHSIEGKSIEQILHERGIFKNDYIRQDKFMKYRNDIKETLKLLI